jgi:hypothetical protein
MHSNVYDVFYSLNSDQHISAAAAPIFRVLLLLQEYRVINVVNLVSGTP